VSQGGTKTFIVLIGSGRRQAIGHYPLVSLSAARIEAKRLLAEKTLGKVRPKHIAFADALDEFLAASENKNRPRTVAEYRRLLGRHYPYGRTSIASIQSRDIQRRLAMLGNTPAERHAAFRAGRAFFRWCVQQRIIERSPLEHISLPPGSVSRERVLTDSELAAIYQTAIKGDTAFHRIVALLVLTGQRRGEIAGLERKWISGADRTITIPSTITKNRRTHIVPYGAAAAAVLATAPRIDDSPFVFPAARDRRKGKPATVFNGWSKAKAAFDHELAKQGKAVAPWTLHDLRRTFASGMQRLGVRVEVTEKLLNHVSGTFSGITGVYQRHAYLDEMREALGNWETHLTKLLQKADGQA
jgi:integrase